MLNFRLRLVDGARRWWKWGSVQLALAVGLLTQLAFAFPGAAQEVWGALPPEIRTSAPAWVPILLTALPVAVRLLSVKRKTSDGQ